MENQIIGGSKARGKVSSCTMEGRQDEDALKEQNRIDTQRRSRMWTTVSSDEEDSQSKVASASAGRDAERKYFVRETEKCSDDSSSDSSSSSTSESDSDSYSDSNNLDRSDERGDIKRRKRSYSEESETSRKRKKHKKNDGHSEEKEKHRNSHSSKKHKKEKKDHHSSKKKKNDEKKSKKNKKEKKNKKDKKHKSNKAEKVKSKAVDQNEFGKYGVIREEHFFSKQREFESYMAEVKNMPGIMGQSKKEVRDYFKAFIEDYNTATMPSEKYYNLERWEMEEYRRKQDKNAAKRGASVQEVFNDEEIRRIEIKNARAAAEKKEFDEMLSKMSSDRDRRESMRRQDIIRAELKNAYKQGDMTTVRRLEKVLAPDEEKGGGVKHPWA